jgi:hypothetical protein
MLVVIEHAPKWVCITSLLVSAFGFLILEPNLRQHIERIRPGLLRQILVVLSSILAALLLYGYCAAQESVAVPPATTTAISAPSGIAIGGGTVTNPIVNNYNASPSPEYSGLLKTILDANKNVTTIEIGTSGVRFTDGAKNGGYDLNSLEEFLRDSALKIENENGQIKVSIRVLDSNKSVIAEIIRNEWSVSTKPTSWDRNYNENSLEVKDNSGKIVLQVTALPDRIRLQVIFTMKNGNKFCLIQSNGISRSRDYALIKFSTPPEQFNGDDPELTIQPLFKYPSDRHLHELAQ